MFSKYIKNIERKNFTRGGHTLPTRVGGAPPYLVGPLVALRWPSSAIWSLSMGKIISHLLGQNSAAMRRNLGGAVLPGKLPSRRGKSSPSSSPTLLSSGESNLHQHLHQHHLISKPYFISCIQFLSPSPGLVLVGC